MTHTLLNHRTKEFIEESTASFSCDCYILMASFAGGEGDVKIIASFYFSISFLKFSCKVAFLKKEIYI